MEDHKFILARAIDLQIEMLGEVADLKLNSYTSIGEMLGDAKDCLIGYRMVYLGDCLTHVERAWMRLRDNKGTQGIRTEHVYNILELQQRITNEAKLLGTYIMVRN